MKKYSYLIAVVLFISCNKTSTGPTTYDKEPTVTAKYFLKYKLDDKWVLVQNNLDDHVDKCSYCISWWDGDITLEIDEFFPRPGLVTKANILALKGRQVTFSGDTLENFAVLKSSTTNFSSGMSGLNSSSVVANITNVTDLNKLDDNTDESILVIEGNFTNLKVKDYDVDKIYTVTNGTFKLPVGTSIY